ncbi:MAG TPA: ADOP family duplicated permease [Vicinamibacteria bacterium]|nr:ADOP family duplicated permease [Vicinamibacteria bacterium]
MRAPSPPRLAEALLARVVRHRDRSEEILGDLAEEHREIVRARGRLVAHLWYWYEALGIGSHYLFRRHRRKRERRRDGTMRSLLRDSKHALRGLLREPSYTAIVVVTLALGIGANAAVFSMVDALVLRPFPIPDIARLVMVWQTDPSRDWDRSNASPADFLSWKEQTTGFDDLVAMEWWDVNLSGVGEPERLQGSLVTPGFLDVLGVEPLLGRTLGADRDQFGAKTAVISYQLFSRRFGSDSSILGTAILLNGERYDVVGVAEEGFDYPYGTDVWAPLWFDAETAANRESQYLTVIGRMREGTSVEDLQSELELVSERLAREYPSTNEGRGVKTMALARAVIDLGAPAFLAMWQATTAFVLLIACVNVANLLMARGGERQRELCLQQALGAGRYRIVRQLLTENLWLAALGALLAVPLAWLGIEILRTSMPANIQRFVVGWKEIDLDWRALGFTAAVALVTAFVFGLLPAWRASRPDLTASLKEGGRASSRGRERQRGRSLLVVTEVALTLMLLVASGLSIRGAIRLTQSDQGYDPDGLMTMEVALPETKYDEEEARLQFYRALVEGARQLPEVVSADCVNILPSSGSNTSRDIEIEGQPVENPSERPHVQYRVITDSFFETMRIPIFSGRTFDGGDRTDTRRVTIVSQGFAERFWTGDDPLGRRFRISSEEDAEWLTVVGVSGDVLHDWFLGIPGATFYVPMEQAPRLGMHLALRVRGDPEAVTPAVRAIVREIDPDQPLFTVMSMRRMLAERTIGLRYAASVMAILGLIALVLAAVGIYGVIAYSVSRRSHEIGVRVALGADRRDVLKLTVGQAVRITGLGIAAGLLLAYGAGRLMASHLFGVVQLDATTFVALAGVLATASLLAGYVPARRALELDPVVALRTE